MYQVLLYYQFYKEKNPQAFRDEHQNFCESLGLKGRVYVANEGINGTVSGPVAACEKYQSYLRSRPGLENISFKTDACLDNVFEKMKTKVRPYILNMGFAPEDDVDPSVRTGKHLSPEAWRNVLENEKDFVLLDIRNNYESKIGHFAGAVCPDLAGFTEFKDWVPELKQKYQDKKILMYCTGGIRCEKYSSLLLKEGFADVNQLYGGILNYAKEEGGKHFLGKCFVFDDRLVTDVDPQNQDVLAQCERCGRPEYRYVNCANMTCNRLFLICDDCARTHDASCSDACYASAEKRPFDAKNFRVPFRSKGKVFPQLGRRQFKT